MRTIPQIDEDFVRRIYRTSGVVWALVALMVEARWGWTPTIGLTLGAVLALGSLRALERAIRKLITPEARPSAAGRVVAFGIFKMFLIAAFLSLVIVAGQRLHANLPALLLGLVGGLFL